MNSLQSWPEPIIRVQSLSDSGLTFVPDQYVKLLSDRPSLTDPPPATEINIPVIDLSDLFSPDRSIRSVTARPSPRACREWEFFQVVNHGVSHELMKRNREVWHEFFELPLEEKQAYVNSLATYEGYGSRLGVEKGMKLDWSDYFYLHYLPESLRDQNKWLSLHLSCRSATLLLNAHERSRNISHSNYPGASFGK